MKTIGVIGAGTMGSGIAQVSAQAGFSVVLFDSSPEAITRGLTNIAFQISKKTKKGEIDDQTATSVLESITAGSSLGDLSGCDLIIEAIVENLSAKRELFRSIEAVVQPQAIIATNTSSLSVTAIISSLHEPERGIGLHFFNPATVMKLVEVISGYQTGQQYTEQCLEFVRKLGKTPITARDLPGFIVNRCARPFYGEALRLLSEGVATVETIDQIVRLEGGFKMGPFELMDLIGIDVNLAVTRSMYEQTFGEERYRPSLIQQQMVDSGRLGKKTKRGFYRYDI